MRAKSVPRIPSVPRHSVATLARLRPGLLRWFGEHARKLPWRLAPGGRDPLVAGNPRLRRNPYAVWMAEIMLQQTQVSTAVPYFEKWLRRFPDPGSLAAAPEEEVLRLWAGLGYYARARNLHRAARVLVETGRYPESAEGWRELPGIGPYTAGAVVSLALDLPEPILDGNVTRVFSRLFGLAFLPGDGKRQREAYWTLARRWADGPRPGDANEALMELGALICAPSSPRCPRCPLASGCVAKKRGLQGSLPPARRRPRPETVLGGAWVVLRRGRVLMHVRPPGSLLAGHAMFPLFLGENDRWKEPLPQSLEAGVVRHSIMSRRYLLNVRIGSAGKDFAPAELSGGGDFKWIPEVRLEALLTNSLARKIWAVARPRGDGS